MLMILDEEAYRNPLYGSWYIEELILMLELYAHIHPLDTIAKKVSRTTTFS